MKRLSLLMSSLLLALTSCIQEAAAPEELVDAGGYSVTTVSATDAEEADTKSILTVDPCEIETLQVFAFDPQTDEILIYGEGAGAALKGNPVTAYVEGVSTFEWCLPVGVELDIYAVANIGKIDVPASVGELLSMDDMKLTFDSLKELNELKAVPMHGILEGAVDDGNGNELLIRMKKVLARYDISIVWGDDMPEGCVVDRLTVRNANRNVTLFASGEAASSVDDLTWEMDFTTEEDKALLNDGGVVTLYLPENMQSSVNGTTSTAASWREINEENMTGIELCTFMEIAWSCFGEGDVQSVFFGKHPTTNFDVERNLATNVRVNMSMSEGIIVGKVLEFTGSYEAQPGDELLISYKYRPELIEVVQSDFSVSEGLEILGVSPEEDESGTLTVKVSESIDIDSELSVTYIPPQPYYSSDNIVIMVDVVPVLEEIFFQDLSLSHYSDYFMPYDVYGRYSDGSEEVVSDLCSFSSSNPDAALFAAPYEVKMPAAFSYYLSRTNDSYGILFGESTGTSKITATLEGLSTSVSVTNKNRYASILISGSKAVRDVFVRNGESSLVLQIGTEYGYPVKDTYPSSSRILPPMILKYPDSYDNTSSAGSYPTEFDFESSETVVGTYPSTLTITAGNRIEVIEIEVLGLASCVTGSSISGIFDGTLTKTATQLGSEVTKTGGYRKMFTLRVHVNLQKSDLGTLKEIIISGPELVLDGDQAIYSAIGRFVKDGQEVNYDISTDGIWSSSAFENNVGCGVFTEAKYSSSLQEVSFNFNGYSASLPVLVYRYSKFSHQFVDVGDVYKVNGFWMRANFYPGHDIFDKFPAGYLRVYELKITESFYDVNDEVKDTKELSYYYEYQMLSGGLARLPIMGALNFYESRDGNAPYDALSKTYNLSVTIKNYSSYQKSGSLYSDNLTYKFVKTCDRYAWNDDSSWEDAAALRLYNAKKVN